MAMDLNRTGFADPLLGTASFAVPIDANGNLVTDTSGVLETGSKKLSINFFRATVDYEAITDIYKIFLRTFPGSGSAVTLLEDEGKDSFTVKWISEF